MELYLSSSPRHNGAVLNLKHDQVLIYYYYYFACGSVWALTLWEEHRKRVFENRVLRRIFGPKRDEATGNCITRKFITCALHQT
jgi:hypothetical protein